MIIDEKTIREALEKGERVTLECKQARSEVPKELWNTYSAFANTVGGLILLGVEEHRKEADPARRFEVIDNNLKVVGMDGRNIVLPVKETVVMSNDKTEDNNRELSDVLKSVLKENLEKLTDRQIDILCFITEDSKVTLQEMSKRLKVSVKTVQRDFEAMRKLGISIINTRDRYLSQVGD